MVKAYSYLRFSTPEQERGDSFRRQSQLATKYAAEHGLELDNRSFQDLGVSAYRGANAETGALGAFLEAVEAGEIPKGSFLLVESLDRISRAKPRKAVRLLEEICDAGITLVTLADGRVYTQNGLDNDPMAFMYAFMVTIRANDESATKARRLKAAWENKRAKVRESPLTSRTPAWVRLVNDRLELIPERTEVVRRIFAMTLEGVGQHTIAETLNREGVPVFGRGKHWHRSYVKKILENVAVIGTLIPHRMEDVGGKTRRVPEPPVPDYYPPVVDPETFSSVRTLIEGKTSPARGRHAGKVVSNVLGGLARCPACEGTMTLTNKGKGWRYLVCTAAKAGAGCEYRGVKYDPVEASIFSNAGQIVGDCPSDDDRRERVRMELEVVETQLSQTADEIREVDRAVRRGAGSVTLVASLRELEARAERLKAERDRKTAELASMGRSVVDRRLAIFREGVEENDRTKVNTALRQLVEGVTVDYRAGELVFLWRHATLATAIPYDPGAAF